MPSSSEPFGDMTLRQVLRLSYVPRWVIVPMIRQQTVSDHSWRTAVIAIRIAHVLGLDHMAGGIALSAVLHDMDEALSGDIPSTFKEHGPAPNETRDLVVKIADLLESKWWAVAWARAGDSQLIAEGIDDRLQEAIDVLDTTMPGARSILFAIESEVSGA